MSKIKKTTHSTFFWADEFRADDPLSLQLLKKNAVHVVQIVYKQVALLEHKWMTAEIATGRQIKYRNVTAQIFG